MVRVDLDTGRAVTTHVLEEVSSRQTRLSELRRELGYTDATLNDALLELTERGEVAIVPAGEVVQVKRVDG